MATPSATGSSAVAREVAFSSAVFTLDVLKKAAYRLIDRATVDIRPSEQDIICTFTLVRGASEVAMDALVADFKAEVLDQDLREKVGKETAQLRNAILALAFAPQKSTGRE